MGKRGPIPKKDALKIMSGQLSLTKQNGANDIATFLEPPDAPKHLTKEEKEIWNYTVELLRPMKVLEKIDWGVLSAYCCSYVRWRQAETEIQKMSKSSNLRGLVSPGANGNIVVNPLVNISKHERNALVQYAVQLGMTPAARMRVNIVEKPAKENPFINLRNKKNGNVDTNSKKLRQGVNRKSKQE